MPEPTWTDDEQALAAAVHAAYKVCEQDAIDGGKSAGFSEWPEKCARAIIAAGWSRQSADRETMDDYIRAVLAGNIPRSDEPYRVVGEWLRRPRQIAAQARNAALEEAAKIADNAKTANAPGPFYVAGFSAAAHFIALRIRALQSHDGGSPGPSPKCDGVICQASKLDGVVCADDECDVEAGLRPYPKGASPSGRSQPSPDLPTVIHGALALLADTNKSAEDRVANAQKYLGTAVSGDAHVCPALAAYEGMKDKPK